MFKTSIIITFLALCFGLSFPASAQMIGMSITESSAGDFDADVAQAKRAGAQFTSLTLYWDEADFGGTYSPEFDWPVVANSYYPGKRLGLLVSLAVIDTVVDRRPADLLNLPFDDPRVLARFEIYASEVLSRLVNTDLVTIIIGNEVDGYLASARDWREFGAFFAQARAIVNRILPGVPVGFSTTWDGLRGSNQRHALAANASSDALFINYYPLDSRFRVIAPDDISHQLDQMIALAAGKKVFLTETGYPSNGCGSSEAHQLAYFQHLLGALAERQRQIPLVELVWLHDISDNALAGYRGYYGLSNRCFSSYLATLGLRHEDGRNKPAFEWLLSR